MKLTDINVSCQSCSLSELCLPRGLNSREMEELDSVIDHKHTCEQHAYLYSNGEPLRAIYAVHSGSFKATVTTPEGAEQILGFYLPGELLGLDAFAGQQHSCNAIALEQSTVCELPFPDFDTLCGELQGLRRQLMCLVGREITNSNHMLLALGQMTAEERLATFLLSLSRRFAVRGFSATSFNLTMSRQDLANYLGIAIETVSRLFTRMQEKHLLVVDRRSIHLKNLPRLQALAHDHCTTAN